MSYQVGDTLTPFEILVTPESMKEWAVFLRDPNPIHLDPEVVKAKGLGDRVINQGPTNVAYVINMLQKNFPTASIEEMNSRFVDNVYGGETVVATGTITEVVENTDATSVSCELILNTTEERTTITATATVKIPK